MTHEKSRLKIVFFMVSPEFRFVFRLYFHLRLASITHIITTLTNKKDICDPKLMMSAWKTKEK